MAFVGMALSETDGKVFLSVEPVDGRERVDAATLHDWLVREGFGACQVDHDALERALSEEEPSSKEPVSSR